MTVDAAWGSRAFGFRFCGRGLGRKGHSGDARQRGETYKQSLTHRGNLPGVFANHCTPVKFAAPCRNAR